MQAHNRSANPTHLIDFKIRFEIKKSELILKSRAPVGRLADPSE